MKVFLDTVGCRLNQSEIETFARQFRAAGHDLVATPEQADLVVVNTCAVTAAAASDSRQKIRQASRAGVETILATGCWATLEPEKAAQLPSVNRVFSNDAKEHLVADTLGVSAHLFEKQQIFDLQPIERQPLPGTRARTRAFIKVQDGCDNRCTFCITTIARGRGQSYSIKRVLDDIQAATGDERIQVETDTDTNAKEVVLSGVHLGSWGQDFEPPQELKDLIQAVLDRTNVPRVRLSSLEPWDLADDFFDLWENPRLCRHLHLPLQSGCGSTLRRMARKTTPDSFAQLMEQIRTAVPEMAVTTDLIVGFPGETEEEFEASLDFVRKMNFAGGHVFPYSARPGTAAARMPKQVPHRIRKERSAKMRQVLSEAAEQHRKKYVGQRLEVLWESATHIGRETWQMTGISSNYLKISGEAPASLWNQLCMVKITGITEDGLSAEIETNGSTQRE